MAEVETMEDNMEADSPDSMKAVANNKSHAETPATTKTESPSPAAASKKDGDGESNKNGNKKSSTKKSLTKSPSSKGTSKSYIQLVHEAIVSLKDRTGSSQPAIMKYLLSNYPALENNLSQNRFKTNVLTALKSGVKQGRFEKVKASYKISSEFKKKEANARKRKKQQELKKKKDKQKEKKKEDEIKKLEKKDPFQAKIDALRDKNPDSEELKKLLAEKKRKEEAEARKKYIAERLKKRRFPMEDTKLHAEDTELGVKPPKDVTRRPDLPNFFSLTQNDERRSNKSYASAASRCEGLEKGCRGIISDLLQVYHFFRGDVHYMGTGEDTSDREIVPAFTLKHLIHAVDDILNGTAKKSRMVPPLLVHLFVTCLQILTAPPDADGSALDDSPQRRQLQQDFATHLNPALSSSSWADVCFMYMDALERHMTTEASVEKNVLPGLPIDADYLLRLKDEESEMPETSMPDGYTGYLGDREGVMARAQMKLERMDPWLLTAEELMALLRALTDDMLARKPEISEDISSREEKMYELLKAKRAADTKFRKVRLAYEGPKKPKKPAAATTANADENGKEDKAVTEKKGDGEENGDGDESNRKSLDENDESKEKDEKSKTEAEWKPTATKKQFETAKKAQLKASEAYEKGVRKLMARTEPIGYDRDHNAVYCFRHDPEVLYIEMIKPDPNPESGIPEDMQVTKSNWHVIETKSLFDQYVQSLDVRGKRENNLYEELMGPHGAQQSLRRFLFDDIKVRAEANARLKEMEQLKRRLENAKLKCDEEEGRRSGRLANKAEEELSHLEDEISKMEQKIKSGAVSKEADYEELTGLELLRKYDSDGKMETRRTREKKITATVNNFEPMKCSQLCSTGNIDGTGIMGLLVSKLLELEETCESLAPWDSKDITRQTWISDLENLVFAWNNASPVLIGPADASASSHLASPRPSMDGTAATPSPLASGNSKSGKKRPPTGFGSSDSKRSKTDSAASSFPISQAVHKLRQPLLDLEKRVFEITGLAMAAKDSADADDNMSTSGEEENAEKESKERRAWKKTINKLYSLPSKRHVMIREIVVEAIAAARKAQLKDVVGQLRTALLEFHPNAAGACKTAALKVLDLHGGYDEEDDDEEGEEEANEDTPEADEAETPSALSAEAVIVNSSLDGIEDAGHVDWVDAVKSARTLSRMATLVTAFVHRASGKLRKLQEEHDALMKALATWEKDEERRFKNQAKGNIFKKSSKAAAEPSEVWAHVNFTDEICMAKVEDYPWWPAKKCMAKDVDLEASLKTLGRCLVSVVGESGGIRVVETSAIREFTGNLVEDEDTDMSGFSKETRTQLDECMAMARRILRARSGKKGSKKQAAVEEKKVSS